MCVIDDRNNGWRTIILPTAHLDSLVQLSVIAAAALHFQNRTSSTILNSAAIYAQALQELRKRQDLAVQSSSQQQGVLLALLVLLAAAMIQGSADFRSIFTLIDKAVEAVGGEDQVASGELGTFIIRQIRKSVIPISPSLPHRTHTSLTSPLQVPRLRLPNANPSHGHPHPLQNHAHRALHLQRLGGLLIVLPESVVLLPLPPLLLLFSLLRFQHLRIPPHHVRPQRPRL